MSEPRWGVKRRCNSCEARFYDLGRDPIHCPKCGAVFVAVAMPTGRPGGTAGRQRARGFGKSYQSPSTIDSMTRPPEADLDPVVENDDPAEEEESDEVEEVEEVDEPDGGDEVEPGEDRKGEG